MSNAKFNSELNAAEAANRLFQRFSKLDSESLLALRVVIAQLLAAILTSTDWVQRPDPTWAQKAKITLSMGLSLLASAGGGAAELKKVTEMGMEHYLVEILTGDQSVSYNVPPVKGVQ